MGEVRSLLEHLFCRFDRQAGVCWFSRSWRGGRQRGEGRGGEGRRGRAGEAEETAKKLDSTQEVGKSLRGGQEESCGRGVGGEDCCCHFI